VKGGAALAAGNTQQRTLVVASADGEVSDGAPSAGPLVYGRRPRIGSTAHATAAAALLAASRVGFMLLDASLKILSANSEAIRILAYPGTPTAQQALHGYATNNIAVQLLNSRAFPAQPAITELSLGRRRYLWRVFALDHESGGFFTTAAFQPSLAIMIERANRAFAELTQVSDDYQLTPREREAMELLLHGLTSKQIAERMRVSPNTVKAFLHSIMLKMNVRTRAGIVARTLAKCSSRASVNGIVPRRLVPCVGPASLGDRPASLPPFLSCTCQVPKGINRAG
jgi:DNA-binding CsgD family transcriptional regulator